MQRAVEICSLDGDSELQGAFLPDTQSKVSEINDGGGGVNFRLGNVVKRVNLSGANGGITKYGEDFNRGNVEQTRLGRFGEEIKVAMSISLPHQLTISGLSLDSTNSLLRK